MNRIIDQPAAVSTLRTSEHRGGLTGRMLIASGLLALLLSLVDELRALERRVRQSEEVLEVANVLERLVVDVETAQRGYVITHQDRLLEPWRRAQVAFPEEAATFLAAERGLAAARARRSDAAAERAIVAAAIGLGGSILLIILFSGYLTGPSCGRSAGRPPWPAGWRAATWACVWRNAASATRRDGGSDATCTTAPSSGWSRWCWTCGPPRRRCRQSRRVADGLTGALEELRELSRGIQPAILSEGGLAPALKALARPGPQPGRAGNQAPDRPADPGPPFQLSV
jgi:CHASE3 domain